LIPPLSKKNKEIFAHKSGAGAWLWKPWIILDTMKKAPENALNIYANAGSVFTAPLAPLLKHLDKQSMLFAEYDNSAIYGTVKYRSKRDIFIALDCDKEYYWDATVTWAGFMVLGNNEEARAFIHEWLTHCKKNCILSSPARVKKDLSFPNSKCRPMMKQF
jgi:hypothetical protein